MEVGVAACVLRQVVAPHEALLADGAAELLLARVRAIVSGQLVGARELLVALLPAAGEGPLTWVPNKMQPRHLLESLTLLSRGPGTLLTTTPEVQPSSISAHMEGGTDYRPQSNSWH